MQARGGSFFGRRKGKTLKPAQREALSTTVPALLLDLTSPAPGDLSALFSATVESIHIEIGFGGGEHLRHEAERLPQTGFIGIEPFQNGFAKLATSMRRDLLPNIRLYNDDAAPLLDWLPAGSLARIDLLYPDPWPKTRHWKRRFVNAENLARIERCLITGGVFRFASDVEAYVKWTLREVARHGGLAWVEGRLEHSRRPWEAWPGTRYEAKAIAEGRRPTYLSFMKRG